MKDKLKELLGLGKEIGDAEKARQVAEVTPGQHRESEVSSSVGLLC